MGIARIPLAFFLIFLLTALPAQASSLRVFGGDDVTLQDTVNMMNSYAVPLSPLEPGVSELKIVPAYLRLTNKFAGYDEDMKGVGLAVAYTRGISKRWGFSVLGAYGRLSGTVLGLEEFSGGTGPDIVCCSNESPVPDGTLVTSHRFEKDGYGIQAAATVIFDPFGESESFRLPLMLGLGGIFLDQEARGTVSDTVLGGASVETIAERKEFILGLFTGISAQIMTGPIRWVPFFSVQIRLSEGEGQSVEVLQGGTSIFRQDGEGAESLFGSAGLNVQYMPWGLTFSYIPSLPVLISGDDEPNPSIASLTKSFRW